MKIHFPLKSIVLLHLPLATISAGPSNQSLKGKSDDELLGIVVRGRNDAQKAQADDSEFRERSAALDVIWELTPKDAALKLASVFVQKEAKGRVNFTVGETSKQKPPDAGEIGIRWISGNYYAMPERGILALRYERPRSRLIISDFQILGRVSDAELEDALRQTDEYEIPVPIARQVYETLWWLNRVQRVGYRVGGTGMSSVDDVADGFWMTPDGPYLGRVLLGSPNAEDLKDEEFSSFPAFAYLLIHRIIERQGIKQKNPRPTIGHFVDINADAAFLRLHPAPETDNPKTVKLWVERMIEILKKPERYKMYGDVLHDLVPTAEPLKYKDSEIDRALLDLFHHGEAQAAAHEQVQKDADNQQKQILEDIQQGKPIIDESERRALSRRAIDEGSAAGSIRSDVEIAAQMLSQRDQVKVFPELMKHAERFHPSDYVFPGANALIGAAELASRHPELRPQLRSFLRAQLDGLHIRTSQFSPEQLFNCVWRSNDRELSADLEKLATHSPDENEDTSMYSSPFPPNVNGKFHAARAILTTWRETDRLTKAKLDALLTGYIGWGGPVPDFLRTEVEGLSADEKLLFQNFITWLRKVDAPFSKETLEDVFTPHTPHPKDIDFGLRRFWYE